MGGKVKRVKALGSAGCFAGVTRMRVNDAALGAVLR